MLWGPLVSKTSYTGIKLDWGWAFTTRSERKALALWKPILSWDDTAPPSPAAGGVGLLMMTSMVRIHSVLSGVLLAMNTGQREKRPEKCPPALPVSHLDKKIFH